MKIRYSLAFILLIVAFYLLVHLAADSQKKIGRGLARQQQKQEMRLMIASLETFLSSAVYGLNALPGFPAIQRGSDPDCLRDMGVLFPGSVETSLRHLPPHQFNSLRRVGPDGLQRYYLGRDDQVTAGDSMNFSTNPAVIGATQTGELFLANPVSDGKGQLVLWMAAPVYETIRDDLNPTAHGQFSGTVLAEIDAGQMFQQFISSMRLSSDDSIVVLDRATGLLAYSTVDLQQVGQSWKGSNYGPAATTKAQFQQLRKRIFSGALGVNEFTDAGGSQQLVSFYPFDIGNRQWSLVREIPKADSTRLLTDFNSSVQLIAAAALLAMLICFALLSRSQQQRIRAQEKELLLKDLEKQVEQRTRSLRKQTDELEATCRVLQHETSSLAASRQEYRMLVEGIDFGLMRIGLTGDIKFRNDALLNLTGGVFHEIKGVNLLDLPQIAKQSRSKLSAALERLREFAVAESLAIEINLPQGGNHWFDVEIFPLRIDQQLIACLIHFRSSRQNGEVGGTGVG